MYDVSAVRHAEAQRMSSDRLALAENRVREYDERWGEKSDRRKGYASR